MKQRFLSLIILTLLALPLLAETDLGKCRIKMENAAVYEYAQQLGCVIGDVKVLRFDIGPWTEGLANNSGSGPALE